MESKWIIFELECTSILEVAASTCGLKIIRSSWWQCKNPLVGTRVKVAFQFKKE